MNREEVLKQLVSKGIFYGGKYTVQAMYLWNHEKGTNFSDDEFELCRYSVCENYWIKDGNEKHLCPYPIEDYEIEQVEQAVDSFIEKEKQMKDKMIKKLKRREVVRGDEYAIVPVKTGHKYSGFTIYKNSSKKNYFPEPVEDYELFEVEEAISSFLEKENANGR